ncbi:MAG: PCRF domain-containing protein, partial [Planctomycetia bacterium]
MEAADFWSNTEKANTTIGELKALNGSIKPFDDFAAALGDVVAMIELAEEADDPETTAEVEKMLHQLERSVGTLEFHAMMNEEADSNNAFVTIQ